MRRVDWPDPVGHIEVTRVLHGGRSGVLVVEAVLRRHNHRLLHVVKFGPVRELAQEWRAYHKLVYANALCAPILAATPDVVRGDKATGDAALVYDHASQFTGDPGGGVRTFEDLARAALTDPDAADTAVKAVEDLLAGIAHVFHNRSTVREIPTSLRSSNPTLGPSLVLELHDVTADSVPADEVLQRTLCGTDDITGRVVLENLKPRWRDDVLFADGDDITVELRASPDRLAEWGRDSEITARGTIVATRGAMRRAELPVLDRAGDPFEALPDALTQAVEGRALSVVHGDLNPRNIMLSGSRACVIDYARTSIDGHQQADFCWLEAGLVRDVFADLDVLTLQRVLALATQMISLGVPAESACLPLLDESLHAAFRVLLAVRRRAHASHVGRVPWRTDYLTHLLLAAHRTLKWTGDLQSPAKLSATAAIGAVVTEWLSAQNPFQYWTNPALVFHQVAEVLPGEQEAAVALCADLVRARAFPGTGSWRDRLVRETKGSAAQELMAGLAQAHRDYVPLTVTVDGRVVDVVQHLLTCGTVALVGAPGSGKSTVAAELVHRLAARVLDSGSTSPAWLPVTLDTLADLSEDELVLGVPYLIVDGVDELGGTVLADVHDLRQRYPKVPVLFVCRTAPAGWPSVRLPELDVAGMRAFLHRALVPGVMSGPDADHMLAKLLADPGWQRTNPGRPATLRAIADRIKAGLPVDMLQASKELAFSALDVRRAEEIAAGPSETRCRMFQRNWQEAFVCFAIDAPAAAVLDIVRTVAPADPVFAARLLWTARLRFPAFTDELRTALTDADAGPAAWQSAKALCELGDHRSLMAVAVDDDVAVHGRMVALLALSELHHRALSGQQRRDRTQALAACLRAMLSRPTPPQLVTTALEVLCIKRVPGLELLAAERVRAGADWEQVSRAMAALRALGTALPDSLTEAYRSAARDRLSDLDRSMRAETAMAEIRVLARQRHDLIAELAEHEPVSWLLRQRFAFDADPALVSLVDERLSSQPPGTDELAAAHCLLRDHPERSARMLASTKPTVAAHQLLIAAAQVSRDTIDAAESLFTGLLEHVDANTIEPLSALLVAIFTADRTTGVRLAWTAAAELAARGLPERHRWPWVTALARSRGSLADLEALLETNPPLALDALASHDFHRSAARGPSHSFSTTTRTQLLSMEFSPRWMRAAATVSLVEALPVILAKLPGLAGPATRVGSARHGVIEHTELGDALAVAGYLSTLELESVETRELLRNFPTADAHPSVEIGRLIGLAYIGEWQPLLTHSPTHPAARNAIGLWAHTPPLAIAEWLAARMRTPGLLREHRWALADLTAEAELRAGVVVAP
nr:hypothetical protein [Kibdelosporangium phytohabitans]